MKFVLVVLAALGLTVAWQASVIADNNKQHTLTPVQHNGSQATKTSSQPS